MPIHNIHFIGQVGFCKGIPQRGQGFKIQGLLIVHTDIQVGGQSGRSLGAGSKGPHGGCGDDPF